MEFAQLNADGSYSHQITTHGNVEWDLTHYCPASALTPEEAALFRVVPLEIVTPPVYDAITTKCFRDGGEFVDGVWRYKWAITPLDAATITANVAAKKAALKTRTTEKRVQVEEGGTVVGGMPVATDAQSQARLTGALNFVGRNPARVIKWKGANGQHVAINNTVIEAMSDAIGEFVALCFDAEASHYAAIDALTTPEQVAAYDVNTGWPVS